MHEEEELLRWNRVAVLSEKIWKTRIDVFIVTSN